MKRLIALLLAAALSLSLAACTGNEEKPEGEKESNISSTSTDTEADDILDLDGNEYLLTLVKNVYNQSVPSGDGISVYGLELSKSENAAKFSQNFIGKTCQLTGVVFQINSDSVILGYALAGEKGKIGPNGGIKVYLDSDELVNLKNLDTITVAGTLVEDESNEVTAILEDAYIA